MRMLSLLAAWLLLAALAPGWLHAQTPGRKLVFAYLADTHISDVQTNVEDLEACVADINANPDIQFVILGGDVTEFGSDREIYRAKELLDKLSKPYYVVAGNHDAKWSESGCNTFAKVFGYEQFSFQAGGIQFIGTNSGPNMRMAPALVPRETMIWLRDFETQLPVVFINHYPLNDAMLNYKEVLSLLAKFDVKLILCGHGHSNRLVEVDGYPAAMGRSVLRAGRDGAGYNLITIDGGRVTLQERVAGKELKPAWHSFSGPNPIWSYRDDSDIGAAAIEKDGVVYFGNTKGVVKALDASNGKLLWEYATRGKIFSTPAIENGRLVIGSTDSSVYCLDAKTGKLLWSYAANKSVLSSPTIHSERVYVGASDGVFRCIELASGKLVWSYPNVKGFVETKPLVDEQGVYFGDWANRFYKLNPKTGTEKWVWTNGKGRGYSAAAVWPVKANGLVFVVTPERKLHAIDDETGKDAWTAKGGREAIGLSPDGSAVYVKTMQDSVFAFPTTRMANSVEAPPSLWRSFAGYGYEIAPSPLTVAGNLLLIPTDKGNVFALRTSNGSVAWRYKFSGALISYVQPLAGSRLLVCSMDGKVGVLSYQPAE